MKEKNRSIIILSLYVVLYAMISIVSWINSKDYWIDGLTAAIGCILFLFLNYKFPVHPIIALLEGAIFIPNQLGFAFLYNMKSLNYHGDWIIHFVGSVIFVIIIIYYLRKITHIKDHIFMIGLYSFAISITAGTLLEQAEYWGFIFFGFGNSYLGFGIGDNSLNFGPWENSSLDVLFNLLGTLAGIIVYLTIIYLQKSKKDKKIINNN